MSVITFNSDAQQVAPLTELTSFQPPSITANGQTCLGKALAFVAEKIGEEVQKTSANAKGDWKPLVFLMTDGAPTDDWQAGLNLFEKTKTGLVVACAAGPDADTTALKQITEMVVRLDTADSATIKAFFKWVSASISTSSKKVETGGSEVKGPSELPPPPKEIKIVL